MRFRFLTSRPPCVRALRTLWVGALLLGAAVVAAPAGAQPARPLTLAEALELARRNAPAVVQAEGQVRANAAVVRASRGAFLPNVALSGSTTEQSPATARLNPSTGELIAGRWATNAGITANVNLFDGFQRLADLRAARAGLLSADAQVTVQRASVGLQVKQQFFAALAAREAEAAALVQRAQADTQLAITRARVLAQTATRADSLQSLIQVAQADLAIATARNDRVAADAALGRLVGATVPVTAAERLADSVTIGIDSAALEALAAAAPQVQQSAAALDAARASRRAARAPYFPTLAVNYARNGLGGSAGFDLFPDQFRYSGQLRFTVSLPIFDQFTRQQAVAQAEVALANADAQARDTRLAAAQTVAEQLAAFRTAQVQQTTQRVTILAAEETLRVQQQRYQLGASTVLDVLTAQNQLAQGRLGLVQARFAARTAKAQLEALVGRDL